MGDGNLGGLYGPFSSAESKAEAGIRLLEVSRMGKASQVTNLIERGADPNVQDDEGMTPLHHAAAHGARTCIRVLVKIGRCDYLLKDSYGRYASQLAMEWGRDYAVARLLLKKEAMQAYQRESAASEKGTETD